jgi:WD40 repeat protein
MAWTAPVNFNEPQIVDETDLNLMQDNLRELWHLAGRTEFTGTVTATPGTNTEAAPLDIVSAGALTLTASPTRVVFGCRASSIVSGAGTNSGISLWDTTDLGSLMETPPAIATTLNGPLHLEHMLTVTAASHTFKVRLWAETGSTATVSGGAGGAGVLLPGFIEVWQKGGA